MYKHYARTANYDNLINALEEAIRNKYAVKRRGPNNLALYNYTEHCTFERAWTDEIRCARGLVVDEARREIVATPFIKFFNYGEFGTTWLDQDYEVFDKLDGSLIILYQHEGEWYCNTRGSFESNQAIWARAQLNDDILKHLPVHSTYLLEAIYPENKIVVGYPYSGLVLLAAYWSNGQEYDYNMLGNVCRETGWRLATRHTYHSFEDLHKATETIGLETEGFVVRFADGTRLKMKGLTYKRVHALVMQITPLGIWRLMYENSPVAEARKEIPEEFWDDFDQVHRILQTNYEKLVERIDATYERYKHLTDKELGLRINELADDMRLFVFKRRKPDWHYGRSLQSERKLVNGVIAENNKNRVSFFKVLRPTGNSLMGYVPSYGLGKVLLAEE